MKIGVVNPNAASASGPRPATHILSARLYAMIRNIDMIIGTDSKRIARLGSPVTRDIRWSTSSVNSLLELINTSIKD
jgi:hypothetical protein